METWKKTRLGDVLEYEQPTDYIVNSTDYKDEYKTPVLTAGQSFILGNTDETENIFTEVPVIIFDDFTTATKYVDFPFKVKSSAMKILKADKKVSDIRFLYYLLQIIEVDSERHKRYWISQFAELNIPLPPLPEQKKIAALLDAADAYRQKTKELITQYDLLAQSLFLDMFGDPVTNPKGWKKIDLGKLTKRVVVGHVGPTTSGYVSRGGVPFLRTQNVRKNFINTKDILQINKEFHTKLKKSQITTGDILISRVGVNRGMAAVVPEQYNQANCANVVIVGHSDKFNSLYISYFLNKSFGTKPEYGYSVGSAQGVVNTKIVKKWPVYDIPLKVQNLFGKSIQGIELQKSQAQASLSQAEDLFNSLLQRAFKGGLKTKV